MGGSAKRVLDATRRDGKDKEMAGNAAQPPKVQD